MLPGHLLQNIRVDLITDADNVIVSVRNIIDVLKKQPFNAAHFA
ncbi:hypothetical protein SB719_15635 [Pantoea sp. SIMBA_079]